METVTIKKDELEDIVSEICDKYCKWPGVMDSENEDPDDAQKALDKKCWKCPLYRMT